MSNSVNGYNRFESISKIHGAHEEILELDVTSENDDKLDALSDFASLEVLGLITGELAEMIADLPEGSPAAAKLADAREALLEMTEEVIDIATASLEKVIAA